MKQRSVLFKITRFLGLATCSWALAHSAYAIEPLPPGNPLGARVEYFGNAFTYAGALPTITVGTNGTKSYWDATAVVGPNGPKSLFGEQGRTYPISSSFGREFQAFGYSNLSSGALGVLATAIADGPYTNQTGGEAIAVVTSSFSELLTLSLPSASSDHASPNYATTLSYSWSLDGSGAGPSSISSSLIVGGGSRVDIIYSAAQLSSSTWTNLTVNPTSTCGAWTCTGSVTVYGKSPQLSVRATLTGRGAVGNSSGFHGTLIAKADFSNTAAFAFTSIPADMTYTSASGSFLVSTVPEPTTIAYLLAGFLLLVSVARRRLL